MLNEFKQYLLGIGKSENTALNYCDKVKLYFNGALIVLAVNRSSSTVLMCSITSHI